MTFEPNPKTCVWAREASYVCPATPRCSKAQFPEQPHSYFSIDAGRTWHYQCIMLEISNFLRLQGNTYGPARRGPLWWYHIRFARGGAGCPSRRAPQPLSLFPPQTYFPRFQPCQKVAHSVFKHTIHSGAAGSSPAWGCWTTANTFNL